MWAIFGENDNIKYIKLWFRRTLLCYIPWWYHKWREVDLWVARRGGDTSDWVNIVCPSRVKGEQTHRHMRALEPLCYYLECVCILYFIILLYFNCSLIWRQTPVESKHLQILHVYLIFDFSVRVITELLYLIYHTMYYTHNIILLDSIIVLDVISADWLRNRRTNIQADTTAVSKK